MYFILFRINGAGLNIIKINDSNCKYFKNEQRKRLL